VAVFLAGVAVGEALTVGVAWLYPVLLPFLTTTVAPLVRPAPAAAEPERPAAVVQARADAPTGASPFPVAAPAPLPVLAPRPVLDPGRQAKADDDWGGPKAALLPSDLGKMGPSLKTALDRTRSEDMAFCFRDLTPGTPRRAGDVMLYLEVRDDVADVVDAKVAREGTLPPDVMDCCREVLRGLEVKVTFPALGRYRYVFEVEE
jgi:hypothetical protein